MPNNRQYAAVHLFNGDTFLGLSPKDWSADTQTRAQAQLFILSGLYGLLKPYDAIEPYRLEMGCGLKLHRGVGLVHHWQKLITPTLDQYLGVGDRIINCASDEYARAIDKEKIKNFITIDFKIRKNDRLNPLGMAIKRQRGALVRAGIENNCQTIDDLKQLSIHGFSYDESLSRPDYLLWLK